MAKPKILRGTYVNILLGDGASPETFNPLCGITTRRFTHQTNTTDTFIRDCADPEDVPEREISAASEQWDLSGSGMMNRLQLADILAADGQIRNYRYELGEPAADLVYGGYWEGAAMLTNLSFTGDDGAFVGLDLSMASHGEWTFVPA